MESTYIRTERNFKRRYLIRALIKAQGRVSVAAKIAGLNRSFFYQAVNRHGIDLGAIPHRDVYSLKPYKQSLFEFERKTIRRILVRSNWSPVEASRLSGISRTHFYKLVERLGLEWPRVLDAKKGNAAWRELGALPPAVKTREVSRPIRSR